MESARLFCHLDSSPGEHKVQCTLNPDQMQLPMEAGAYTLNVRIPPLWLGSDVYSVYFKIVGRTVTGEPTAGRQLLAQGCPLTGVLKVERI
jgi:hypothetical protein